MKEKNKMTEKEKEIIIDALESGIKLNEMYLDKVEYLHDKIEDEDDEKKIDYWIKKMETKVRIETLEKLKDQYK